MKQVRIGNAHVDFDSLVIESDAGRYSVEPKVLEVLKALINNQGEVVAREDLIDQVWGVSFGGDERLSRAISLLRKAFGDRRGDNQHIETISKRGYRLISLSEDISVGQRSDAGLAILPFTNISGDSDSAFLADGLCLDLTNLLSRVPEQKVAPHSSAIQYANRDISPQDVATELGVRFIVSGSFHRIERDFRLRVQLNDAQSGVIVWANRYDAELDAFFGLQDDIVRSIATTINSELEASTFKEVLARPDFNLSAYEHIQAAEAKRWTYSRAAAEGTVAHLRTALEIEPDNVMALARLIGQLSQNLVNRWDDDPVSTMTEIGQCLRTAQAIDPTHPEVALAAGIAAAMSGRADRAVPVLERAVQLDPNNPHGRALLGWQRGVLEKEPASIELIRSAESDAPHHPQFAIWANYRANVEFALGNFESAVAAWEESAARNPNFYHIRINEAMALAFAGRVDEATKKIREGLDLEPSYTFEQYSAVYSKFVFNIPKGWTPDDLVALMREAWPDQ